MPPNAPSPNTPEEPENGPANAINGLSNANTVIIQTSEPMPLWRVAMHIFNTLLGVLLASLGVAWAIKSYNITTEGTNRTLQLAESANKIAQNSDQNALIGSLVALCQDENAALDADTCSQYLEALGKALSTALPLLQFISIHNFLQTSLARTDTTTTSTSSGSLTESSTSISTSSSDTSDHASMDGFPPPSIPFSSVTGTSSGEAVTPGPSITSSSVSAFSSGSPSPQATDFGTVGSGSSSSPSLGLAAQFGIAIGVFVAVSLIAIWIYWKIIRPRWIVKSHHEAEAGAVEVKGTLVYER